MFLSKVEHSVLLSNSKVILVAVLLAVSCCYDLDTESFQNTFGSAFMSVDRLHSFRTCICHQNVNDITVIISHFGQHNVQGIKPQPFQTNHYCNKQRIFILFKLKTEIFNNIQIFSSIHTYIHTVYIQVHLNKVECHGKVNLFQ